MDSRIIKNRVRAVRRRLNKKKINCLIITKPANVTYITGFLGADSWAVVAAGGVYLITDSRYTEQAHQQCPYCKVIQRARPIAEQTAELLKKLKSAQTVAVEEATPLATYRSLKRAFKTRLRTTANIIETLRSSKDSTEIAAIGRAARMAIRALKQIRRYIKPGITENELAGVLDLQIRRLGATNSFATIIAFGPNASRPHHQPGARRLKKNDTILIDFGVAYKGYCCDLTRCFAIGKASALFERVYEAVKQAQAAAIKMVKAGTEIRRVDDAARDVLRKFELPVYGHGTGHGIGLEVHEQPVVSATGKGKLEAGMVFTIEPGVYIPGKLGVRIEDNILVTDKGHKILTRTSREG
jgi:Xaa-Pro aminopeptidase